MSNVTLPEVDTDRETPGIYRAVYRTLRGYDMTPAEIRSCVDNALAGEQQVIFEEPCNCEPGNIQHNNGGNYHAIVSLAGKTVEGRGRFLFLVEESTRDEFPMDTEDYYLLAPDGRVVKAFVGYGANSLDDSSDIARILSQQGYVELGHFRNHTANLIYGGEISPMTDQDWSLVQEPTTP